MALSERQLDLLETFLRWWVAYYGRYADLSDKTEREKAISEGLMEFVAIKGGA